MPGRPAPGGGTPPRARRARWPEPHKGGRAWGGMIGPPPLGADPGGASAPGKTRPRQAACLLDREPSRQFRSSGPRVCWVMRAWRA